jgi:hypothetical protein
MTRPVAYLLLAAAVASLSACSSVSSGIGDHLPNALGGLPEGSPERPATPAAYPAVHDIPPNRGATVFTAAEKKRLQDELAATRAKNAHDAAANPEAIDIAPPAGASRR